MRVTAVLAAGGNGSRMGEKINKVFMTFSGVTVLEQTVEVFLNTECIDKIVIVIRKQDLEECRRLFADKPVDIVEGGKTRQESVYRGLSAADEGIVVIHDAARPFVSKEMIEECVRECEINGAAAVGIPCVDTLKRIDEDGFITQTVDRNEIVRIQTPQAFLLDKIKRAHEEAAADGFVATDDCALYEKYAGKVKLVRGEASNIKITYREDLLIAERLLKK